MPEEITSPIRRIRVVLAAKLRADWSAVVEVPADASDVELTALVDDFFHRVEMDDYVQDDEYWGKGECGVLDNVDADEHAAYRGVRNAQGKLVYLKIDSQPVSLWCVVHGEAFVPDVFNSRDVAEAFKAQCDDYVSGPWEVAVGQS